MIINKTDNNSIDLTVEKLLQGDIVIIPTDTVYGFSGIVNSEHSTDAKIRIIKGREETKPFIQLIGKPEDIYKYTKDEIPENLFEKWPGALTIIVNDIDGGTTAFRCPGDSWLRSVINKVGLPLYSTSVNKSGNPILENIDDIKNVFQNEASLIVNDGDKKDALPSTLVKIEKEGFLVLRQGSVVI